MSKLMARVRGKTFQVTESWSKDELTEALNQYHARGFVVCLDYDHPNIDDPQALQAAKLDFEDRIKKLKENKR